MIQVRRSSNRQKQLTMAFIEQISDNVFCDDSFGNLKGCELMEKMAVEYALKDLIDRVEDKVIKEPSENISVVLPVARVLLPGYDDDGDDGYDGDDGDDGGVSDLELTDDEDFYDINSSGRKCEICSQSEWTIRERIRTGPRGEPVDRLREHEGRLMCGCCQEMLGSPLSEFKFCCSCFVSEKMGRRYGISMIPVENSQDENVCSVCNDIYPDIAINGEEDLSNWTQLLDGTWVLEDGGEEEVYGGEYENEDLRENNTEIAKEIKGTISEIGEQLFDIHEKLKEGEYLKLMDLLQKVTNDVNRL